MNSEEYKIRIKVLYYFFNQCFQKYYWIDEDFGIVDLIEDEKVILIFKSFSWLSIHKLNEIIKNNGLSKYFRFKRKKGSKQKQYYKLLSINLDENLISLFKLQGMK